MSVQHTPCLCCDPYVWAAIDRWLKFEEGLDELPGAAALEVERQAGARRRAMQEAMGPLVAIFDHHNENHDHSTSREIARERLPSRLPFWDGVRTW